MHIEVKCLAQWRGAKQRQPRPVPKTFQSKVAGHSHRAMTPCMYMEYTFRCIGTLRAVTARELVLSSSFTSHSVSVRRLLHLRGHASQERYTVSNVEGREINLHIQASPEHDGGLNPGPPRDRRARYHLRYCSLLVVVAVSSNRQSAKPVHDGHAAFASRAGKPTQLDLIVDYCLSIEPRIKNYSFHIPESASLSLDIQQNGNTNRHKQSLVV